MKQIALSGYVIGAIVLVFGVIVIFFPPPISALQLRETFYWHDYVVVAALFVLTFFLSEPSGVIE